MRTLRSFALATVVLGFAAGSLAATVPAAANNADDIVAAAVHQDVSPPLGAMIGTLSPTARQLTERPLRTFPGARAARPDAALQSTPGGPAVATTGGLGFAGVGQGDYGFSDRYAPPDVNGAVGATQYVQWVNAAFAIFDKSTGALVSGPTPGNAIWSGFGGPCQTYNDGDPIVQYDKIAGRWIFTQFMVSTTPYLQCVAVSQTSDARGPYYRYAFSYGSTKFNDYPKLSVWPDGYYITYNIFNNGVTWAGGLTCAFDRASMLTGAPATQQCFQASTSYGGLLPSDLDGATLPPAGSPNFVVSYGSSVLNLWKFHVDWSNPANSTFGTGSVAPTSTTAGTAGSPTVIPVASFAGACGGGGNCIPQPGTSQKLDSLADRLMYRLAYRNFGDHESLVVNHSVTAGTSVGVRWYELRNDSGTTMASATPVVFQQSTFAPDSNFRWMGSIAQDQQGNMAVGYSRSSTSSYPSIFYTGRLATDALNTMQAETLVKAGGGSQLPNLSRWGDYSAMTVDPVDDCTFWFTSEYLKASGTFNWSTWITSFKYPSCGGGATVDPVPTSIAVSPASANVQTGATQQFTATVLDQYGTVISPPPTITWSSTGTGSVSASGLYTAGSSAGSATVTASASSLTGSAAVTVVAPSIALSASPSSLTIKRGNRKSSTITVTRSFDATSASFSISGLPSSVTASFSPTSTTSNSTTLTLTVGSSAIRGKYTLTVSASTTQGSSAQVPLTLTIN